MLSFLRGKKTYEKSAPIAISEAKSMAGLILADYKEIDIIKLSAEQKQVIDTWVKPYLDKLAKLEPALAIKILRAISKGDTGEFNKSNTDKAIYSVILDVLKIMRIDDPYNFILEKALTGRDTNKEVKASVAMYVKNIVHKKILQIYVHSKILEQQLVDSKTFDFQKIINLLNWLSESKRYLMDETYFFLNAFGQEHQELLSFLLINKKLPAQQALAEMVNLSSYQAEALKMMYDNGLRGNHLRMYHGNEEKGAYFNYKHKNALKYFIHSLHQTPQQAMVEINGLTEKQVQCLLDLYQHGVRGKHLRDWQFGKDAMFGECQAKVIKYLVTEKKLTPEQTILETNELTWERSQTLQTLYSFGVRGDHLRSMPFFFESQMNAFILLVKDQKISIPTAISEINKCGKVHWYAIALERLYQHGLRADHLLCYKSPWLSENNFTYDHCNALTHMITKTGMSPIKAVSTISYMTKEQVSVLMQGMENLKLQKKSPAEHIISVGLFFNTRAESKNDDRSDSCSEKRRKIF